MTKLDVLIVGLGGFIGTICRYLVYVWMGNKGPFQFPIATLLINVSGCFLIGIFGALIEKEVPFYRYLFLIGSVGFLGAFTTFSTFGLETLNLIKQQQVLNAVLNITANVVFGILAVWVGRQTTNLLI